MVKKERYNLMLNPRVVNALDYQAKRLGKSRSALIDDIFCVYIIENGLLNILQKDEQIVEQLEVV